MNPKQRAAQAALQYVQSGMTVGLGSGSTARHFIEQLGEMIRSGQLANIRGVPTSRASEELGRQFGIPIVGLEEVDKCDVTIDGADEVDPNLNLIKGLGGALLREKMVAQNSTQLVIIADTSKKVSTLGTKAPLPVEVVQFGHKATARFLATFGCAPTLRPAADGSGPYVTDNGNYIYDCKFNVIADPIAIDRAMCNRAGVVETGLFLGMAGVVLLAGTENVEMLRR
jgi:ribose 5-phosphate isomerase A